MLPIPFNNPDTYPGHSGVDFGQSLGTVFRASGPGVVTALGHNPRAGYTIWVRYDVGCEVGYVHMDSHVGCPPVGMRVVEGSQLGLVGNSGNSTGPHLHVEVEGYSTTAGFWKWFTPDRVVGHETESKDPPSKPKGIAVIHYTKADLSAKERGRLLEPGSGFYLHEDTGRPTSNASNIIGGTGPYSITVHVYAEGTPGDLLNVKLIWQNRREDPPSNSPHYEQRFEIDRDGLLRENVEFKRAVPAGYRVHARVTAVSTNFKPVKVTRLETDAYLFKVA